MITAADDLPTLGYKQELKRSLSVFDLLAYGLVFMTPIAPVPLFGIVFNASHGMVPLVYVIGALAMTFTALSYMAMSKEFPVAGSVYTYTSRSLGRAVGFLSGWAILLDYLLLPTIIYVSCAIAVHAAVPMLSRPLCVVFMLVGATAINYRGIETTARASFVLLALQLVIIVVFVVLSVIGLMHHVAGAHLSLAPFYNRAQMAPGVVFGAFSIAALSFLGFDAISTLSEESKGGARAIGRATILSLCICAALFVIQTWLASLFLLGKTSLPAGDATNAAFYDVAALLGGYPFKFLLAVPGIFLAGTAGAVTAQAATARLLYGMARDGQLPHALAHVDPKRKTPVRAIVLVAAITLVTGVLLVNQLELLSAMISFGALVGFLLLHVSVIAHFNRHRMSPKWMRHVIAPAIGFVIIGYVLLNTQSIAKIAGAAWMLAGLAALVFLTIRRRVSAETART